MAEEKDYSLYDGRKLKDEVAMDMLRNMIEKSSGYEKQVLIQALNAYEFYFVNTMP